MATDHLTELTQAELKRLIHYDPRTGSFTWRHRKALSRWDKLCNTTIAGKSAGTVAKNGNTSYRNIAIRGRRYKAHRLAWLYIHGQWPNGEIDHVDRNGLNNRLANLRLATRTQQRANSGPKRSSATNVKGVWKRRNGKYESIIQKNRKPFRLGVFKTIEEAASAYDKKGKELFGEYWSNGRPQ